MRDSIGTVDPAGYDLAVILRPFRSGDWAWDELLKMDGRYVPAGFAACPPGLSVTDIGSQGLAPVTRPNGDVHLGVHEIGHLFDVQPHLGHEDHTYMSNLAGEVWRISNLKSAFDEIGVSNWRAVDYEADPDKWGPVRASAIGPANPSPYDVALILMPLRTGLPHPPWAQDGGRCLRSGGYVEATLHSGLFARAEEARLSLGLPIWHLGALFQVGLACQEGGCVFGGGWPWTTQVCPACAQKLGWA